MDENYFARLFQINVNEHVQTKGQFRFLSWPYAVAQLRLHDPAATWEVKRFDGMPFLRSEAGYFVEVAVTVQGITLSQLHPVLDAKNRPIEQPTVFDINTSIQRCLVKAVALHGLGLYIYAGEDLPVGEASNDPVVDEQPTPPKPKASVTPLPGEGRISQAQMKYLESLIAKTDTDVQRLCDYFHVSNLGELTVAAASRAIKSLEAKRRAA